MPWVSIIPYTYKRLKIIHISKIVTRIKWDYDVKVPSPTSGLRTQVKSIRLNLKDHHLCWPYVFYHLVNAIYKPNEDFLLLQILHLSLAAYGIKLHIFGFSLSIPLVVLYSNTSFIYFITLRYHTVRVFRHKLHAAWKV